jgi:hypothetical protein
MVLKFYHHINAAPRSWRVAKLALRSSEQGKVNTENLASMALIHASATNGSLASSKVGGFMA